MGAGLTAIQRQAPCAGNAVAVFALSGSAEKAMGIPGELHSRSRTASQQSHSEIRNAAAGEPGADPAIEAGCPATAARNFTPLLGARRGGRSQPGVTGVDIVALSSPLQDPGANGPIDWHCQSPPLPRTRTASSCEESTAARDRLGP